jgi:hypothetical protein
MRRRDFIKGIPVWTALPLAARAQPREQKRRVAVVMGGLFSNDSGGQAEAAAFEAGLSELGWKLGDNIGLEYRWPGAQLDQVSIAGNEVVAVNSRLAEANVPSDINDVRFSGVKADIEWSVGNRLPRLAGDYSFRPCPVRKRRWRKDREISVTARESIAADLAVSYGCKLTP